jgi:hypothetical protein
MFYKFSFETSAQRLKLFTSETSAQRLKLFTSETSAQRLKLFTSETSGLPPETCLRKKSCKGTTFFAYMQIN